MAGSLSLCGDMTSESDGSDTVTINGAFLIVSGATTLNRAASNTGTVGVSNEATDFVMISGSTFYRYLDCHGRCLRSRCRHSGK